MIIFIHTGLLTRFFFFPEFKFYLIACHHYWRMPTLRESIGHYWRAQYYIFDAPSATKFMALHPMRHFKWGCNIIRGPHLYIYLTNTEPHRRPLRRNFYANNAFENTPHYETTFCLLKTSLTILLKPREDGSIISDVDRALEPPLRL